MLQYIHFNGWYKWMEYFNGWKHITFDVPVWHLPLGSECILNKYIVTFLALWIRNVHKHFLGFVREVSSLMGLGDHSIPALPAYFKVWQSKSTVRKFSWICSWVLLVGWVVKISIGTRISALHGFCWIFYCLINLFFAGCEISRD